MFAAGSLARVRVAGTVGQEEAVKLQRIEIIVPRHEYHFHVATKQGNV